MLRAPQLVFDKIQKDHVHVAALNWNFCVVSLLRNVIFEGIPSARLSVVFWCERLRHMYTYMYILYTYTHKYVCMCIK